MKQRFVTQTNRSSHAGFFLSIAIFVGVFLLFLGGISTLSHRTDSRELDTLQTALERDIVRCYALEGSYPESLDYIVENYGLTYDSDRYYVDYHPQGSNIKPDVTIIDLEAEQ